MTETRRDTLPEHDYASHEHHELRRGLDRIHDVGALLGNDAELSLGTLEVLHWVDSILGPHALWEDRWLYPEIDQRAGTPWATKLMSFEHQQIREAAASVATARTIVREARTPAAVVELRARLFALEAIIRAHMAREERFLLPLLEAGSAEAAPPEPQAGSTTPAGAV